MVMEMAEVGNPKPNGEGHPDRESAADLPKDSDGKDFILKKLFNTNSYATKKSISQGMLDVALLLANCTQLRYLLELEDKKALQWVITAAIILSIVLQIAVGCLLILMGFNDLRDNTNHRKLSLMNNTATALVFVITVINIIVSGFGMGTPSEPLPPHKTLD